MLRSPLSLFSRLVEGELYWQIFSEKIQKAIGIVFMGSIEEPVVTMTLTLRTPEMYRAVGVFGGLCGRFVRPSSCFVSALFVLFPIVLCERILASVLTFQCR